MFSGFMNKAKKLAASVGVVKTGEEDEAAKSRIAGQHKAVKNLEAALVRYYRAFVDRGLAIAAVHDGMAELYPAEQAFTANLTALLSRNAVWKETNETVVGMKTDIEAALKHVEEKLTTLSKMVADRSNIRIDMDTHTKDIAKYEADPKAGAKLDGSKQKLAEAQERFHATEAVLVPELEQLDKEIAALTTGAFRGFIEAQMRYNAVAMEAYQAGLAAIAVAAPEGEALVAAEGEAAAVVAPEAEIAAATEAMHLEPAPAAAEAAPAAVEAAAPAAEEAAPVAAAEPATFDPFAAADAPAAEAPAS